MATLGDDLIDLLVTAQDEVILAAPFMKEGVVGRLLASVDQRVSVTCVTRWRPEEIRAGVSDLGVWGVVQGRNNARLLLRNDLHAKYYRGDEQCLIGSANLTGRALGWSANPNFELLVRMGAKTEVLAASERNLIKDAVVVNQDLVEEFEAIMSKLPPLIAHAIEELPPNPAERLEVRSDRIWIPVCRYPEQLFQVYAGKSDHISTGGVEAVEQDLAYIGPPAGLNEQAFNAMVHAILLQTPVFGRIDNFLNRPKRFGEMRSYLLSMPELANDVRGATELWQTLMRWLLHFLPRRYRLAVPSYSEIILRIGTESARDDTNQATS